jgi:serine/threonine-protein kinase
MAEIGCISDQDLQAFLLGELPDRLADDIARHLDLCPDCETRARRWDDLADSAIQALRLGDLKRQDPATRDRLSPVQTHDAKTVAAPLASPGLGTWSGEPAPTGVQIGRYRLEGELARGGMGVVLRAHDTAFQRTLAVKLLLDAHQDRPELKRRFLEEAQVLGQLQHPGIPPVHDIGELPDGRPFFAMKLIQGRTLAELLRERPAPSHELPRFLAIFGQLCQTVAYAHSRGILQRDLKPANVMVGAFGEVQVMDWGLAKTLARGGCRPSGTGEDRGVHPPGSPEPSREQTRVGDLLGTLAYMASEQARGEVDQVDERADVFGLGAVLCVILTGGPPYVASGKPDVYQLAVQGELADAYARLDRCGADGELVTLAKRCLAPDSRERPRHAREGSEAVGAYQATVQERLRQAEVAQAQAQVQARKERKRRRLTVALALLLLMLLGGGGGVAWWSEQQQVERDKEEAQRLAERDKERALRLAEARSGVEAALQEARGHAERARSLVNNPASWQTTLAAAWSAVERAESLLRREAELPQGALAQQTGQLRAQLEADAKDWQLLDVYDQVRLEQSQWDLQRGQFKVAESYPRLKKALADYGLAIGSLDPGQAVERLRQRPLAVQPYVRAVLEECLAWGPKEQGAQRQWLGAVLVLDADPWLAQFRQAWAKRAWAQVEKLAGQAEVSRYHPAVLLGLARNLPSAARAGQVLLLRRTQQQYPGDFWVNLELGNALYGSIFPGGADRPARAEELPVVNEAVAFWRVAVGLRPGNAPAHNSLGTALRAQGYVKGAIVCYRKALDLEPKHVLAHYNLGLALKAQGDVKGAITHAKKALELDPKDAEAHYNLGVALKA